ncbi:MAG: 4Fe-4S dicluster domain-containing protein [Ruminococcus sp.]|nr:4Fe-4S dicluster domain-containing protein [uncultured Ruminococcus sp.]MEE0023820.1 4Fe-4S dicluster domain-containing protein [Ruminococcus sp.]
MHALRCKFGSKKGNPQKGVRKMEKMQVRFERCKGCGLCVTVCPKKIVALQKEHRNEKGYFTAVCTDQDACISCAMCASICPDCAITIQK